MTTLAGNLAYVSLLSLVPLIAVVFALFAAALVDLILVTLQYCPNNSRTEP